MFEFIYPVLCAAFAFAGWSVWRRLQATKARHEAEIACLNEAHDALLHAHTTRLEAMLDSMIEGLVVLDARGRIALANRAAEALFGFSRMMVGGTLLEAIRHHEVAALAARVGTENAVLEHEVRIESPT
ncbi:MAG: PAS domain-containing protein, partial [Verrucomicrobia bacterium]|nr:PAS domain-containing protein [Verrucomicrobiota bacterium]